VPGGLIVTEFFSARKMSAKIVRYVQKKLFIIINLSTKVEHKLSLPMTRSWVLDRAHVVKNLCNRFFIFFGYQCYGDKMMYTYVS